MKRTQLNVNIDPKLLEKIKESARISGKSLVSYVSDCFVNQIENLPVESIDKLEILFRCGETILGSCNSCLTLKNRDTPLPNFSLPHNPNSLAIVL